ncbi:WD40 repeat-like protein [Trametopsis cervina]|nr:WD40 repeat-like protein [Trametopsis cervina]
MTITQIPRMELSADEVNCLIHAYFQDSGFVHSAFVLRAEGHLDQSPSFGKHVPRGELVELLSKALLYTEVEAHWQGNVMTKNCKAPFTLLERHVCSLDPALSPVAVIQPLPSIEVQPPAPNGASEKRKAAAPALQDMGAHREKRARTEEMEVDSVMSVEPQPSESHASAMETPPIPPQEAPVPQPDDESKAIGMLTGHQSEVFVCSWNPKQTNLLGTGSRDTVINIWNVHDPSPDGSPPESEPPLTSAHLVKAESGDLTSLDWNLDGTLLASGSYDCLLRVCDPSGQLYFSHDQHEKGPVFATKFSRSGQYLLTASLDGSVCVWDIPSKTLHAQYSCHDREPCLDVEWISDDVFASCGADGKIQVMRLGTMTPIKTLLGHKDEINQIRCNASRTLLASCSDDTTARVWSVNDITSASTSKEQSSTALLAAHNQTVSSIAWCPTTPSPPDSHDLLATSSFDGTSRLWDAVTGECLRAFSDHKEPVYALTFSPDGRFFTTGGADGWIFVYDVKTRDKRWSWHTDVGPPGIFEIDWQQAENIDRLAFGMTSGLVGVVDVSRIPSLRLQ